MNEEMLKFDGVSKEYYGNPVLKGISFSVKRGEIHALLGENGAGKSTLMNILFGMPVIHNTGGFGGNIELDGKPLQIKSPKEALEAGIGMVHQEFMLIPGFTVAENIKLGRETAKPNILSRIFGKSLEILDNDTMHKDAREALDTVGLSVEEYVRVEGLPIGYMQFTEIAREIDKTGIKLLVFDEPTAVLTESEARQLIDVMRVISQRGIAIIFITHRLEEVIEAADAITILRDGALVATRKKEETSVSELAELMIGRKLEIMNHERKGRADEVAMRIRNLRVDMPGEEVKGVDIDVYEGEILGIGGLAGQGKVGIPNGIVGLYPAEGDVMLRGNPLELGKTTDILRGGIAFVSEDRRGVGLLLDSSIEENIAFSAISVFGDYLHKIGPFSMLDHKKVRTHAKKMIDDLDIRCTGPSQVVGRLSGGNQQKVCIARALTLNPSLLFVAEPTRGIDIGAKKLVLDLLVELNKQGMTVVMVSSELVELRTICDRIVIVSEGKVADILKPDDSDVRFGLAMGGARKEV